MNKSRKMFKNFFVVIILNLLLCNFAFAAGRSAILLSVKEFLQPLFSLIFVICMIYGAFFVYSKLNGYNLQKFSKLSKKKIEDSKISLVSHLSLGQNKSVDVIEINGQRLLLGVCADKITLLKEFDSQNEFPKEDDIFAIKEFDEDSREEKIDDSKVNELYDKYLRGLNDN